jgi:thiamine-monophosphate kinase
LGHGHEQYIVVLQVKHKALARVLSDFAAMGGEPLWALINVVAPPTMDAERAMRAYKGMSQLAARYDVAVVGGDVSSGPAFELHVFAAGRAPRNSAVLRSGAKAGDFVYVTGELGGSIAGKHLSFEPRVREGMWLRKGGWAGAMIDLSDGLLTDLRHILDRSKVGAEIHLERVPVSADAHAMKDGREPIDHALSDGEDFELLFTIPSYKADQFESEWRKAFALSCVRIGAITEKRGLLEVIDESGRRTEAVGRGYQHFGR